MESFAQRTRNVFSKFVLVISSFSPKSLVVHEVFLEILLRKLLVFGSVLVLLGFLSTASCSFHERRPLRSAFLKWDPSEHDHEVNHPLPINKLIAATKSQNALFIVIGLMNE